MKVFMPFTAAELDAKYGASPFRTANCYMRTEFMASGMDEPYVAYFSGVEAIERFARQEFIYDVNIKITFTNYNLSPRG